VTAFERHGPDPERGARRGREEPFTFAGLGLRSDLAAVESRYPRSRRAGSYVYVAPEESHDHIYGIEVPVREPGRRLRVIFERPDGVPSPDGSGRYPTRGSVQEGIERAYGPPASILEFAEGVSWRADRLWRRGREELRLICFGKRNRPASMQAEAVRITSLDR
jgi:hypothetical protein